MAYLLTLFLMFPGITRADSINDHILQFHKVTDGVYRGARPDAKGLEYLKNLGVKTIINLENDDDAVNRESRISTALGLNMISIPMSGFWSPNDETVLHILNLLTDASYYPVFIHCHHGQDRTGVLVGLYRVFYQQWSPKKAYDEMLDIGFHRYLIFLDHYFREKTGLDDFVLVQNN